MSRVTLHRIEKGEPSVAMGAYLSAVDALGLELDLRDPRQARRSSGEAKARLPDSIRPADYPQLKRLGWQLRDKQVLTPEEALEVYERNWRHVEPGAMDDRERDLLEALLDAFGRDRLLV